MTATHIRNVSTPPAFLYVAFELGWTQWKLAFTTGAAQKPRIKTIAARDLAALQAQIAKAKKRFGLPEGTAVRSCYEAGRDGFWLHRYLTRERIDNVIVDSASIEVNRRKRRAKSDQLDAVKLVSMLVRYHGGEKKVWSVVRVPSVADEDGRCLHRELVSLKDERAEHVNRIKGLLASQGLELREVNEGMPVWLSSAQCWDGTSLAAELRARLLRELERWRFVDRQIKDLENERKKRIRRDETAHVDKVRRLLGLAGVGLNGAWLLVHELFAWRTFANRKQVGAIVGMTPTPYNSGNSSREQGISKAGNRRLRRLMVELAWCWLRWQPSSALSQWYQRRFGAGQSRLRKIGVVAVGRKLLIALWRYLEQGEVPPGARLVDWKAKVNGQSRKVARGRKQDSAA
jgi:transposase